VVFLSKLNVNVLLAIEAFTSLIYVIPGFVLVRQSILSVHTDVKVAANKAVSKKRVFMYGMYSSLNEVGAGIVGKTSDYFIVSAISNMQNVGIYAFATKIYDLIFRLLPFKEFMTIIRPLFFMKFTKKHDEEEFFNVYNLMIKIILPIFAIPCLYFMVFGKSLILYVFDPKYIDAYIVCVLVLASNLYYPFFFPINLVMMLKERMDIALISKIVVVFSIAAGIYAMKKFGVVGVAAVTLTGDFLKNLMILILLKREVKIVYRLRELKNYVIVLLAINVPFFVFANYFVSLPALVTGTLLYFPLTLFLIVWYHPFNTYDLSILEKFGQTNRVARKVQVLVLKLYSYRPF
jgi:O-antigen/teichoic acid export membrane protein